MLGGVVEVRAHPQAIAIALYRAIHHQTDAEISRDAIPIRTPK
jgi:hypothetical protein